MIERMLPRLKKAIHLAWTNPRLLLHRIRKTFTSPARYRNLGEAALRWPVVARIAFKALFGASPNSRQPHFRKRSSMALTVYSLFSVGTVRTTLAGPDRKRPLHSLLEKDSFLDFSTKLTERMKQWRASVPYKDMLATEQARRETRQRARTSQDLPSSPLKVLIVSDNWNFGDVLLNALTQEGFQVRTFYFEQFRKRRNSGFTNTHLFVPTEYYATPDSVRKIVSEKSPIFSDLMEWADIVFVEWCNLPAIWLSRLLTENKRLVVRLHSYEAFTFFPYFVNWGGVDGLIYVSEPVRRIMQAKHGERLGSTAQITLPNVKHRPSEGNAPADRAFVLGLAGYSNANKNPILALEILRILRQRDPRWRLKLVGHPWPENGNPAEQRYRDEFNAKLRDKDIADAVIVEPFTDDVPGWCRSIGFMLSTSDREGTHEVLVEGMSVGAVPIVRQWPMMAPFGGPEAVYPDLSHLIFREAEEAADLIVKQNARFEETSREMLDIYEKQLSPEVVVPRYGAFLRSLVNRTESTSEIESVQ